jgi:type IV pilus assembly protein PilW
MVALLIGLLLIGGTMGTFAQARKTYAAAEANARLQENARYAISVIEADVRMASFWGLTNRPESIRANAASVFPATCGAGWATDTVNYLVGYNGTYAAPCAASGGGAAANTDVLVVRRASSQRIVPQAASIAATDRTRVLVVTNRAAGEVFVPKDIGNSIPPGFATADPSGAPPLADTRELLVNAYYVSRNSSVATGYPALRRKHLVAGPGIADEELLPGVEDLQVQFGIDLTGDESADAFVDPGTAPPGSRVVAVRVTLGLRTPERHGPRSLRIMKTLHLRNAA